MKVGDKVHVNLLKDREQFNNTPEFQNVWVPEMNRFLGQDCVIQHISKEVGVKLEGLIYRFPPQILTPCRVSKSSHVYKDNIYPKDRTLTLFHTPDDIDDVILSITDGNETCTFYLSFEDRVNFIARLWETV